jgi:hypothetical protein
MLAFISDTNFRSASWHWYNCRAYYSTGTELWYTDNHEQCYKPGFTCCIQSTDASQAWCVQVDHHLNMCGEILIFLDLVKIELTNQLNNCMEQSCSWTVDRCSTNQEFFCLLWNLKVYKFLPPVLSGAIQIQSEPYFLWSMLKTLFYYHSVQRQNCFRVQKRQEGLSGLL